MKTLRIVLLGLLLTILAACSRVETQKASEEDTPTPSETPVLATVTPEQPDEEAIIVHNAEELLSQMASDSHFLLVPGGDYDINAVDKSINPEFFDYGLKDLENVILEGQGDQQVDFFTEAYDKDVLVISNCKNMTLKNLNMGHEPMIEEDYCAGSVLTFTKNSAISIENCTLFGCGVIGLVATDVEGLSVKDSTIRDCTLYVMSLMNVKDGLFENCDFLSKDDESIQLYEKVSLTLKDSRLSGAFSDYPAIIYEEKPLFDIPNDGTEHRVDNQEANGVKLINVSFTGQSITSELKTIHESVKATVNSGNEVLGGARFVHCVLEYKSALDESEYLPQIKKAQEIILKRDKTCQIAYVDLAWPGSDKEVYSCYDGSIRLGTNYKDLSKILNDNRKYLSVKEAMAKLKEWYPQMQSYSGKALTEKINIEHNNTIVVNDKVYYQLFLYSDLEKPDFMQIFNVNAIDGSITMWFDGYEYSEVEYATKEQIDAVFNYMKTTSEGIPESGNYRIYCVSKQYIVFLNDVFDTRFLLKDVNGVLTAEPYMEWMGD